MIEGIKRYLASGFLPKEKDERLKFIFLASIFFLVIGAYTLIRDLKNAIFIGMVGKEYIPVAKIMFLVMLVPAILFYSKLVDRVKKYYLLEVYSIAYAISCLLFGLFIGNGSIGIENTEQSPYRIFGWLFYFLVEGFSPFVLSVFWAYANSINTPSSAKKNYGFMVSGSQLGGIFTAGIAWAVFSLPRLPFIGTLTDVSKMQFIFVFAAILLFIVPFLTRALVKNVPENCLHGYEAAHKVELEMDKACGQSSINDNSGNKKDKDSFNGSNNNRKFEATCASGKYDGGIFKGLKLLFQYPYVFGIFSMIFFYEIVTSILGYLRLGVAEREGGSIAGISGFLFKWVFIMQSVGLIISFFGTSSLLRRLGIRLCVLLIPILVGMFVLCFILSNNAFIIMFSFTMIKSLNYAFSKPVVESLYIPTLRDIKFKSKSWIDSFGSKFSKSFGAVFNALSRFIPQAAQFPVYVCIFGVILVFWLFTAVLLGRRFDKAVESNEVIGLSK